MNPSTYFSSPQEISTALSRARVNDDMPLIVERLRLTIEVLLDRPEAATRQYLNSALYGIHYCLAGHDKNQLLMQLAERTDALLVHQSHLEWGILSARLSMALSQRDLFRDRVKQLLSQSTAPICRLMNRVSERWCKPSFPDYSEQKVFGIGLSRTGTKSLNQALSILGYDSAHWTNPITMDLLRCEDYFLFDAFSDITVIPDLAWLRSKFRNAKFIFTERETESWERSVSRHYLGLANKKFPNQLVESGARNRMEGRPHIIESTVYGGYDCWVDAYKGHCQAIERAFSDDPSKLLKLNIVGGDGWSELSGFLDRRVPSRLFPHK